MSRPQVIIVLAALLGISAAAVGLLATPSPTGSSLREIAAEFAQPGITLWWLTLGGPFQTTPQTFAGMAWATVANAAVWFALLVIARVAGRRLLRAVRDRSRSD